MATSSQVRAWWAGYQRNTSRYVTVAFPGVGRVWNLRVADKSAPIWKAVAQIMESEPYLFRETAGGTYSAREPGSTSLHTYALALDLNPSKNPHKSPLTTDMPASFIKRMEGIRANGKVAITWGGRWTAPSKPDAMHYQINVAPADCKNVTWDTGGGTPTPVPPTGDDEVETTKGIQRSLNAAGFKGKNGQALTVDGEWGENTEFAFTTMSKAAKVPPTGGGITQAQADARYTKKGSTVTTTGKTA